MVGFQAGLGCSGTCGRSADHDRHGLVRCDAGGAGLQLALRWNKQIQDNVRNFASDVQAYLVSGARVAGASTPHFTAAPEARTGLLVRCWRGPCPESGDRDRRRPRQWGRRYLARERLRL